MGSLLRAVLLWAVLGMGGVLAQPLTLGFQANLGVNETERFANTLAFITDYTGHEIETPFLPEQHGLHRGLGEPGAGLRLLRPGHVRLPAARRPGHEGHGRDRAAEQDR